jgi:hypothetical protein
MRADSRNLISISHDSLMRADFDNCTSIKPIVNNNYVPSDSPRQTDSHNLNPTIVTDCCVQTYSDFRNSNSTLPDSRKQTDSYNCSLGNSSKPIINKNVASHDSCNEVVSNNYTSVSPDFSNQTDSDNINYLFHELFIPSDSINFSDLYPNFSDHSSFSGNDAVILHGCSLYLNNDKSQNNHFDSLYYLSFDPQAYSKPIVSYPNVSGNANSATLNNSLHFNTNFSDTIGKYSHESSNPMPELKLNLFAKGHVFPAILDSGAGFNYFIGKVPQGFWLDSTHNTVSLADGTLRQIKYLVWLKPNLVSLNTNKTIDLPMALFRVLDTNSVSSSVIIGRNTMSDWNINIFGAHVAFIGKECISESLPKSATDYNVYLNQVSDSGLVRIILSDEDREYFIMMLDNIAKKSWVPVQFCPGFKFRLRRASKSDLFDSPDQLFIPEVMIPDITDHNTSVQKSYAIPFFNKLDSESKQVYTDLVNKYVNSSWWEPSVKPGVNELPAANVFMIKKNEKSRLVVDFRQLNSVLPKVSSESPSLWHVLTTVRLFTSDCLITADVRAAFYKTRLNNASLSLSSGIGYFKSNRMVFGVSFGPGGLLSTLGSIITECRNDSNTPACILPLWVDDMLFVGVNKNIVRATKITLSATSLTGFDVERSKFKAVCSPSKFSEISTLCQKEQIDIPIVDSADILGMHVSFVNDSIIFSCNRAARLSSVKSWITQLRSSGKFTKGEVFGNAGSLSYDPLLCHPEERVCSDALRSLIGSFFSKFTYKDTLSISLFPPDKLAAFWMLINWAEKLSSDSPICAHSSPCFSGNSVTINVSCDASMNGAGIVINSSDAILGEVAWMWKPAERVSHSNVRELTCLQRGVRMVLELVEYYQKTSSSSLKSARQKWHINIVSDNQASVAWSNGHVLTLQNSRIVEKRAILRRLSAISDELQILKSLASVSLSHISGQSNNRADYLSRLLDVRCFSSNLGSILSDRTTYTESDSASPVEKSDSPNGNDLPDIVSTGLTKVHHTIADEMLSQEIDVVSAINTIDSMRYFLDSNYSQLPDDNLRNVKDVIHGSSADIAARDCFSLNDLTHRFTVLRCCFEILKLNGKGRSLRFVEDDVNQFVTTQDEALLDIARSAQLGDCKLSLYLSGATKPPVSGPIVLSDDKSVLLFRTGLPSGTEIFQLVIPNSSNYLCKLIVRDAHKNATHSGAEATAFSITKFHITGVRQLAKTIVSKCLTCRILRAKRSLPVPPGITKFNLDDLSKHQPYTVAAIDYLNLGSFGKVLTCTCTFSRHTTWVLVDSESINTTIKTLRLLKLQLGGLKRVICDQAAYFRSNNFSKQISDELGCTVSLLSSRSPWEGGHEQHHHIGLQKIKTILATKNYKDLSLSDKNEIIAKVTLLLNTRPLNIPLSNSEYAVPLTPDLLAYGFTRDEGIFLSNIPRQSTVQVKQLRDIYLREIWSAAKKKTLIAANKFSSDVKPLMINDPVLVFCGTQDKMDIGLRFGRVSGIITKRKYVIKYNNPHFEQKENIFNIISLADLTNHDNNDFIGPSLVGRHCEVEYFVDSCKNSAQWYSGVVCRDYYNGLIKIVLDNSTYCEVLPANDSNLKWIDSDFQKGGVLQ